MQRQKRLRECVEMIEDDNELASLQEISRCTEKDGELETVSLMKITGRHRTGLS